ncbi:hypothetical protein BUALT_Bualt08G0149500 [Buddleja alternifolia]|uniref:Uncharacterized protein n=1 Tax=Buddleja alternifolia TaxID=168488 RepID=A0AAV6XEN5_9LAMI|nr:hypothetical protein BUALT_Bualt08G0149500 [Buddleja alternifolia]
MQRGMYVDLMEATEGEMEVERGKDCYSSEAADPIPRSPSSGPFLSSSSSCPQGKIRSRTAVPATMEELFQYMKTLRSQINDVADQAAKISVEEHMHCTTIHTLQNDLQLVKNETRQVKEETDKMTKTKAQICSQILGKQRKITSLETDSSTLSQTLEFMQQERVSLSEKLVDRSAYYTKVAEDISRQLKEQKVTEKAGGTKESEDDMSPSVIMDIQAAQAKFDKVEQLKADLLLENSKLRQSVELLKTRMTNFKPELREMDGKSLEEELQALLSDKDGEAEYVQSLQLQITKLKVSNFRFISLCKLNNYLAICVISMLLALKLLHEYLMDLCIDDFQSWKAEP